MNTAAQNRLLVAMSASVPTPRFATGYSYLLHDLSLRWPCKRDHSHDNYVLYTLIDGKQVAHCRACDSESRRANREENRDREQSRDRDRLRKETPEAHDRRLLRVNEYNRRRRAEAVT